MKLQCHPYPYDYTNSSKQRAHRAFFMGLQRKQGEVIQDDQQFDLRKTINEFKRQIMSYSYWQPGMEIYVSHVLRKKIPSFVFPEGYRRNRSSRVTGQQQVEKSFFEDEELCRSATAEKHLKRTMDPEGMDEKQGRPEKRQSISPQKSSFVSPQRNGFTLKECSSVVEAQEIGEVNGTCQATSKPSPEISPSNLGCSCIEFQANADLATLDVEMPCVDSTGAGCTSNSSTVTQLTCEVSSGEDTGHEFHLASSDAKLADTIRMSSQGCSRVDSYEADSSLFSAKLSDNSAFGLQNGVHVLLEV